MTIGIKDKRVIKCFLEKRTCHDGHKLDTDGKRLDGLWMGGNRIAEWGRHGVVFNDLGSKVAQTVQRAIERVYVGDVNRMMTRGRKYGRYGTF